uniref:CLIP domain-containing serine protease n=1 Tax=Musca domestica TaxID=7370 RepID=A0A1I8MPP5_MUSDO
MFLKNCIPWFIACFLCCCCCLDTCWGHRGFIGGANPSNGYGGNFCQTPLGDMGSCVSLKYCPEVLTLFQRLDTNSAKQYSSELQRRCGNRMTYDQYPILCCKHVVMTPINGSPSDTQMRDGRVTTTTTTTTSTTTTEASTSKVDTETANRNSNSPNVLCLTTASTSGLCKPLRECPRLLQQLQRDPNNEEIKANLRTSHDRCGNESTMVCCPTDNDSEATTTNSKNLNRRQMANSNSHSLPSEADGCGLVNQTAPKIVGGDESQIGAWPWMALIGYDPYSTRPFKCGGTLISNRHVITAAHCIRHDLSFVRLGEFDLSTDTETTYLDVKVVKHSKHPQFGKNRRSDLAILLLETVVQFSDLIAPICMPNSVQLRSKSYVNSMPFVAGWGNTEQSGTSSQVLKEAQLPVLENDVCRQIYKRLAPSVPDEDYGDAIICAGYTVGGTDTCQGDSGGPLMIPELYKGVTRYYLIGVVSYGHGCGKVPGIYISTQHWMDWIVEQIETM